jgi:hypothetical protein
MCVSVSVECNPLETTAECDESVGWKIAAWVLIVLCLAVGYGNASFSLNLNVNFLFKVQ